MPRAQIRQKWLRLTEETNAIDYLERAGQFIRLTETDGMAWKWIILALYGALYGFAITACRGTNAATVIQKKKRGRGRLISFDQAIGQCQNLLQMSRLYGGQPLVLSRQQKASIHYLSQEFRNKFEHYIPSGWSIELHGLPSICIDVLDVIRFLAVETIQYQHLNLTQRRRVKSIIYQSKRALKNSVLYKEALQIDPNCAR